MANAMVAAVRLIRKLAQKARDQHDYHHLELAAHLFATASCIPALAGSAELAGFQRTLRNIGNSLSGTVARLANLPDPTSAAELYALLCHALVVVENDLAVAVRDKESLPPFTVVNGTEAFPLSGRVHHWIRPRSALADERDRRRCELKREVWLPQLPGPHPSDQLHRLGMYWASDSQLPAIEPCSPPEGFVPLVHRSGRDANERGSFRIAVCPMGTAFHLRFRTLKKDGRHYFRALHPEGIHNPDALARHLEELLEAARRERVHLLILPELTVDPAARVLLATLLKGTPGQMPYAVVAGSFHIWETGQDPSADLPVNESVVLDHQGRPLLHHHKRGHFRLSAEDVTKMGHFFPERGDDFAGPSDEVAEGIAYGKSLQWLDTSLGSIAVFICADGIHKETASFLPVIQNLRPDLLLLVSMSSTTGPFARLLDDLASWGIGSFFVNARCVCQGFKREDAQILAAWNLALPEAPGGPPTRVRWLADHDIPQALVRRRGGINHSWEPIDPTRNRVGVAWLGGERCIGLVHDLGVHFQHADGERAKRKKTDRRP